MWALVQHTHVHDQYPVSNSIHRNPGLLGQGRDDFRSVATPESSEPQPDEVVRRLAALTPGIQDTQVRADVDAMLEMHRMNIDLMDGRPSIGPRTGQV
jgi:hypothetical protein